MSLTFVSPPRISLATFTNVLTRGKSPAAAEAASLYAACTDAGIDPAVALAFFKHESSLGTAGINVTFNLKNWGSVRTSYNPAMAIGSVTVPGNGVFVRYATWTKSLLDWCQRILHWYVAQGFDTVEKAIHKYAPSSDGNNEAAYIAAVETSVAAWTAMEVGNMAHGDGWYPGAIPVPVSGFWSGNKGRKAIVNHVIVGSIQSAINEFKKGEKSSHFGFAQNGDIYQFVSIWDSAWANGLSWVDGRWQDPEGTFVTPPWIGLEPGINPNWYTLSFEHEGQSGDPWPDAMTASNNAVTAWCADQCAMHIEVHNTLIGHNEISPINRAHCPGSGCDLFAIAAAVNTPTPKPVGPSGTFPVDAKLKAYYDRSGGLWQPDRYGLGYALTPLQPDPQHPGTAIQKFERAALRLRADGGIDALLRSEW